MKTFMFGFLLLLPVQLLSQEVIGSQGEFYSNPTGSLSWTLGEFVTETYLNSDGIFTQGFQQVILSDAAITELANSGDAHVYPNPFHLDLIIVNNELEGDFELMIFDITGKKIHETRLELTPAVKEHRIDLSYLASGTYHVQLHSNERSIVIDRIVKY